MEIVELRPMSLGELLDRTFSLYRRHFWVFVGIMAIPYTFSIPMNFLLLSFQGSMFTSIGTSGQPPSPAIFGEFFAGIFVFLLIFWVVYSIAMAAATHAVAEVYLGRAVTVRDSYSRIRGKFWRLMGVIFNIGLRIFGIVILIVGVFAGIAAGVGAAGGMRSSPGFAIAIMIVAVFAYLAALAFCVYFSLRYAVAVPVLMIENLGVLPAIRRSVQLTRGRRGNIFLALLLATVISYIGVFLFQMPFAIANMITMSSGHFSSLLAFASAASGALGGSLTGPIFMIVIVLCYYDVRIRKEAFDLQFMMSSLNPSVAAATGTVSPS